MTTDTDMTHLRRCLELAEEALREGDEPFGSVLVDSEGNVRREDRNRNQTVDATYHPEIAIARWAAKNMTPEERSTATVYTSGEHCAMCSAAHAWAGLGRIVYISSSKQLGEWLEEMGVSNDSPVTALSIQEVSPNTPVEGPIPELEDEIKQLHRQAHQQG